MREKMLQHEFPFDEKAWGAMKTLLEEQNKEKGGGVPAARPEPLPGPGKRWMWLLLLFFLSGLGAVSVFWPSRSIKDPIFKAQSNTLNSSNSVSENIPASTNTASSTLPFANSDPGTRSMPGKSINTTLPANHNPQIAKSSVRMSLNSRTPGQPKDQEMIAGIVPFQNPTLSPNSDLSGNKETDLPKTTKNQEFLYRILKIECLPTPLPEFLPAPKNRTIQPDSLIKPGKNIAIQSHRRAHGFILGMNANAVDYNPIRWSVLPHAGYFLSFKITPRSCIQTEAVLKLVTGYQLKVETLDLTPFGSSYNSLKTNNILYLELPVLYKRKFTAHNAWLAGIKPSGNVKLFPSGTNSYTNDSGFRQYTGQSGIRYFDLGLVLGWEWRPFQHWALDVRYNQGLLDMTFDQFYRDNSTHLNSDVQVTLRYFLGK